MDLFCRNGDGIAACAAPPSQARGFRCRLLLLHRASANYAKGPLRCVCASSVLFRLTEFPARERESDRDVWSIQDRLSATKEATQGGAKRASSPSVPFLSSPFPLRSFPFPSTPSPSLSPAQPLPINQKAATLSRPDRHLLPAHNGRRGSPGAEGLDDGLVQPLEDSASLVSICASVDAVAQASQGHRHEGHQQEGQDPRPDSSGVATAGVSGCYFGRNRMVGIYVR